MRNVDIRDWVEGRTAACREARRPTWRPSPVIVAAFLAAVLAAVPAPPVAAQAADAQAADATDQAADPFDTAAFDTAAGLTPAAGLPPANGAAASGGQAAGSAGGLSGAARTEYLVGGAVLVSASAYAAPAFDGYAASSRASGKLFGKVSVPDYGTLYMSYNLSQALFEGVAGKSVPGAAFVAPPADLFSPTFALGELHYGFDLGKVLFLRLGKQLLAWGPSQVWTPVDFVNRQHADFFSAVDLRQGTPGLKLHLPMGKANAFLFADFSGLAASGVVRDPVDATNLAARLDATFGGFEFGITGFGGYGVQAKAGFDLSGDFLGSAAYGEFAVAPAYSSYPASYLATLGLSRALGDLKRWTLSGEVFYNSAGADHTGDAPAMAALSPLYIGSVYGYAAVSAKELLSPDITTRVFALANFSDLSWSVSLANDFSFARAVPFTLTLAWAGGGAGQEFTRVGGDNSLSVSAQTRIEF
jgi:hypothetical protein